MQDHPSGKKSRHVGAWIVAVVAILEIAVAVGIVEWVRSGACALPTAGTVERMIGGGGGPETQPTASGNLQTAAPAVSSEPSPSSGASGTPGAGSANVSGDLNQVPDPKCVGKTAAGLLNAGASTTPPSCPPMSPPPGMQTNSP